jgi:hypothetical protein
MLTCNIFYSYMACYYSDTPVIILQDLKIYSKSLKHMFCLGVITILYS